MRRTAQPSETGALLANLTAFTGVLRQAGLPVGVGETTDLARALDCIDLGDRDQFFHAARGVLVRRQQDLSLFEALFDQFFRARGSRADPRPPHRPPAPKPQRLALADFLARGAGESDPDVDLDDRAGTWSASERLHRRDFADLDAEELIRVRRLIERLDIRLADRTTRRQRPHARGPSIDLRRALADAARHGSVPARLPRKKRATKPRPLVLIADISGSMERYARLVLLLFYALSHNRRQAGGRNGNQTSVESFVFGTRLTRITHALALRNVDRAVDEAAAQIADWSGGTRIGDCLADFNRRWARRVLRRGAVAIVVSDGCDRGEPETLHRAMRFLAHRTHRLIWLNPLMGDPRYAPRTRGMMAALPFVDDFLPVHNLTSLEQLAAHLEHLPARRSARRHHPTSDINTEAPAMATIARGALAHGAQGDTA